MQKETSFKFHIGKSVSANAYFENWFKIDLNTDRI